MAKEQSKPIVDIRFDRPYGQIESSFGDEWTPTWARDDVLYTGSDDGTSFGGIPVSNMAFGKLEGDRPEHLMGTTVSDMKEFREPPQTAPEGAIWNIVATVLVNGRRYRFGGYPGESRDVSASCLMISSDEGRTWSKARADIGSLFARTNFSSPSFVSLGRPAESGFGGKPGENVYAVSYAGVADGADQYILGKVTALRLSNERAGDWSFLQDDFTWGPLETAGPLPNSARLGPDAANWKAMNSYAVDGVLYMFITRCTYPWNSMDPKRRHWWQNASIIKSTDGGKTWTRDAAENFVEPMFPGHRFATPYFVWYGKNGAACVDNADSYVYAVSNNGFFENGDDYILGRVPRTKLSALSVSDWSFYQGGDGMQDGSWTSSVDGSQPILVNPSRSSMTGMTYIAGLSRYVMVVWHYHRLNFEQGMKDKDLGTVLEFFEAGRPWGPWTKFKSFDTGTLGWYTPVIGQRFQQAVDAGTVTAFLYMSGLTSKPEGGLDLTRYKLNYVPITLSTVPLSHNDPKFVGQHSCYEDPWDNYTAWHYDS